MEALLPSLSGADLLVLRGLGEFSIILGLVGAAALFLDRRGIRKRWLGLLFVFLTVGGLGLAWRAGQLLVADRDLTPTQQAALSEAISQFSDVKFEVHTLRNDREAKSLAQKIVDAIKAGSGAAPQFVGELPDLDPGVIFVFAPNDTNLRRDFSGVVGTRLAAARIAVITSDETALPEQTVLIVVGRKP